MASASTDVNEGRIAALGSKLLLENEAMMDES